MKVKGLPVLFT